LFKNANSLEQPLSIIAISQGITAYVIPNKRLGSHKERVAFSIQSSYSGLDCEAY